MLGAAKGASEQWPRAAFGCAALRALPRLGPPRFDVAPITRCQGQAIKIAQAAPLQCNVFMARGLADNAHWSEHDEERRIGIRDDEFLVPNLDDIDAELFVQLAAGGIGV
jgi:hypothetical protein